MLNLYTDAGEQNELHMLNYRFKQHCSVALPHAPQHAVKFIEDIVLVNGRRHRYVVAKATNALIYLVLRETGRLRLVHVLESSLQTSKTQLRREAVQAD